MERQQEAVAGGGPEAVAAEGQLAAAVGGSAAAAGVGPDPWRAPVQTGHPDWGKPPLAGLGIKRKKLR